MEQRHNPYKASPAMYKAMRGLEKYLHGCGLEGLLHLARLRVSQINGYA